MYIKLTRFRQNGRGAVEIARSEFDSLCHFQYLIYRVCNSPAAREPSLHKQLFRKSINVTSTAVFLDRSFLRPNRAQRVVEKWTGLQARDGTRYCNVSRCTRR